MPIVVYFSAGWLAFWIAAINNEFNIFIGEGVWHCTKAALYIVFAIILLRVGFILLSLAWTNSHRPSR